jgi:hypothetical protein
MDHQCWCRRWAPAGWSYMSLSLSLHRHLS